MSLEVPGEASHPGPGGVAGAGFVACDDMSPRI